MLLLLSVRGIKNEGVRLSAAVQHYSPLPLQLSGLACHQTVWLKLGHELGHFASPAVSHCRASSRLTRVSSDVPWGPFALPQIPRFAGLHGTTSNTVQRPDASVKSRLAIFTYFTLMENPTALYFILAMPCTMLLYFGLTQGCTSVEATNAVKVFRNPSFRLAVAISLRVETLQVSDQTCTATKA